MRNLLILVWGLISCSVFAASEGKVSIADYSMDIAKNSNPSMSQTVQGHFTGGTGSTSSDPATFYFQVKYSDGVTQATQSRLTSTQIANLPSPVDCRTNGAAYLFIDVEVEVDSSKYLTAAIQNSDGTYSTFRLQGHPINITNSQTVTIPIEIAAMCSNGDRCFTSSGGSGGADKTSGYEEIKTLYFYIRSGIEEDSNFSLSSRPDGVFVKVYMTDKLPQNALTLSRIERGDGRVQVYYQQGMDNVTEMSNSQFHKILVFDQTDVIDEYDGQKDGSVVVTGLENARATPYRISVALQNKYLLYNPRSTTIDVTPATIEMFLKKNACYLLSAGFQQEHYVLAYFRNYRDSVLLHHGWGRSFVSWYYDTAPQYAPLIYKSHTLSFLVRCAGYVAYFIFNNFMLLLAGITTCFIAFLGRHFLLGKKAS